MFIPLSFFQKAASDVQENRELRERPAFKTKSLI